MKPNFTALTRAQLATAILEIKGKPLSFNDYLPFIDVYDLYPDEKIGRAHV